MIRSSSAAPRSTRRHPRARPVTLWPPASTSWGRRSRASPPLPRPACAARLQRTGEGRGRLHPRVDRRAERPRPDRADITRPEGRSFMPNDLRQSLKPEQMDQLVAYLAHAQVGGSEHAILVPARRLSGTSWSLCCCSACRSSSACSRRPSTSAPTRCSTPALRRDQGDPHQPAAGLGAHRVHGRHLLGGARGVAHRALQRQLAYIQLGLWTAMGVTAVVGYVFR